MTFLGVLSDLFRGENVTSIWAIKRSLCLYNSNPPVQPASKSSPGRREKSAPLPAARFWEESSNHGLQCWHLSCVFWLSKIKPGGNWSVYVCVCVIFIFFRQVAEANMFITWDKGVHCIKVYTLQQRTPSHPNILRIEALCRKFLKQPQFIFTQFFTEKCWSRVGFSGISWPNRSCLQMVAGRCSRTSWTNFDYIMATLMSPAKS